MKKISREEEYQALRSFLKLASDSESPTASDYVSRAIAEELTPRQRQLAEMYYLRQIPMQYIAGELGISVSTVSRTLARARKRLERCLRYGGRNLIYLLED